MEENIQEKTLANKISDFIVKWGGVIAAGLAVVAALFLLAPNVMVEIKYYVGDEKVKEYFAKSIIDLCSGKQAWAYISILCMVVCRSINR
ncbi:MAG: hypothetical protein MJ238_05330 [Bacilli bacterium]|nr:hypothetical protein [Bacilli bacterium]